MTDREEYEAAKAAEDALEKRRKALLRPTDAAWEEAQRRTEEARDAAAHKCEFCGDPIFDGEPYCYSSEDGIATCKPCSPTYADIKANPENFLRWSEELQDTVPMTAEEAEREVSAHLAKGGSLDDSLAR